MRRYASTSPEELADTVFGIAASKGLEAATIREVATAAGVSIGAVQHHFPTKDDLYAFAFDRLVRRVRERIARIDPHAPLPERLIAVLSQLLPLDEEREREGRVMLSFAARAATSPTLAEIQRATLAQIRRELAAQLTANGIPAPAVSAALLLAVVDGLTLDTLSSMGLDQPADLVAVLSAQVRLTLGSCPQCP